MTLIFLGLLAAAWIAVFLPSVMRARQAAPLSTAERFKRRMALLAPRARTGRWIVVPESYDRLARASFQRGQRRRIQILLALLLAALATFAVAFASGGAAWEVHLVSDASLGLYVVLLREAKRRRTERTVKVRTLRGRESREPEEEVRFYEPVQAMGNRSN